MSTRAHAREPAETTPTPSLDSSGDQWLHAHLTVTPQTVARLATNLDATTETVTTALTRLESLQHAQRHTTPGQPDGWSLPAPSITDKDTA